MSEPACSPPSDAIRDRIGAILFDRFEILRPVGAGGMSTIYLARHRLHMGSFAVKVLHPHLAREPEIRACFYREALYAARVAGHPNFATVFDAGESGGLHYLVMPYIRGEDLDSVWTRYGKFSVDEAMRFAAQMARALRHAEEHDILHADLTPGNLRLNPFGFWIVLDFGLARPTRLRGTELFRTLRAGTPSYMSPERIRGEPVDIRSDLYSLGVILFELLTGRRLFEGESCSAIEHHHLWQTPQVPQELTESHPRIAELLHWLLKKSREERPRNSATLEHELHKIVRPPFTSCIQPVVTQLETARPARRRLQTETWPNAPLRDSLR